MKLAAVALGALLGALLTIAPGRSDAAIVHPGDIAPDFHKTDLDGNMQTLFQYRGKVVVMFSMGWS